MKKDSYTKRFYRHFENYAMYEKDSGEEVDIFHTTNRAIEYAIKKSKEEENRYSFGDMEVTVTGCKKRIRKIHTPDKALTIVREFEKTMENTCANGNAER